MSLLAKYFGMDEEGHGGNLAWPGTTDGYPIRVRGNQPLLTQQELENVPVVLDAKVRIFDLSKPDDLKDYEQILDRHYNGWYKITTNKDAYDSDTKNWRVRLEWVQIYGEIPTSQDILGRLTQERAENEPYNQDVWS